MKGCGYVTSKAGLVGLVIKIHTILNWEIHHKFSLQLNSVFFSLFTLSNCLLSSVHGSSVPRNTPETAVIETNFNPKYLYTGTYFRFIDEMKKL